jgi:predicted DNA-binding transcriptional regulator AlpA
MTAAAVEPPAWPLLPCPGGWVLGKPQENARYLSMTEVHQTLGGNKRALYQLRRRDGGVWFPDPAILVGDIGGWLREDIVEWGIHTGRLHEDGSINTSRFGKNVLRVEGSMTRWRRVTQVYLSTTDLGLAMGMESGLGVTHLGLRGNLLDPDVISGRIKGWSIERGERFAAQTGRSWNLPGYIVAALDRQSGAG